MVALLLLARENRACGRSGRIRARWRCVRCRCGACVRGMGADARRVLLAAFRRDRGEVVVMFNGSICSALREHGFPRMEVVDDDELARLSAIGDRGISCCVPCWTEQKRFAVIRLDGIFGKTLRRSNSENRMRINLGRVSQA